MNTKSNNSNNNNNDNTSLGSSSAAARRSTRLRTLASLSPSSLRQALPLEVHK